MPSGTFELIHNFSLLRHGDVYGIQRYASYVSLCFKRKAAIEKPPRDQVLFLYRFKRHFAKATAWRLAVEAAAHHLDCQQIVAVPAHSPGPNSLQRLFGIVFERMHPVEPRKYTRASGWPEDYTDSYTLHIGHLKEEPILLVDDIYITGETLNHFRLRLEAQGHKVLPLALGIDYKLQPKPVTEVYIYRAQDRLAADLNRLRL